MSSTIRTNDGSYYEKPGFMRTAAGIVAASSASGAVALMQQPFAEQCMKRMGKIAQTADTVEIRNALQKALVEGGVADKVKIRDFANEAKNEGFFDIFRNSFKQKKVDMPNKKFVLKVDTKGMKLPTSIDYIDKEVFKKPKITGDAPHFTAGIGTIDKLKEKLGKYLQKQMDVVGAIKKGKNAGFNNLTNEVLINTEKLGVAGFHEIGHAINYNNSKFWSTMQKLRKPAMIIPSILTTIALFKRKKAEGEEPKGFFDKTTTFIKEHVGTLATLSMAPIVAEEIKATQRGNALAKKLLSPESYKKVVKSNKYGAATYIAAALAVGAGAYIANKVKDAIAKPKEIRFAA